MKRAHLVRAARWGVGALAVAALLAAAVRERAALAQVTGGLGAGPFAAALALAVAGLVANMLS